MCRNKKGRRELSKVHLGKRKGSITVESLALVAILLVIISLIGYVSIGKIKDENNFWVSYGINSVNSTEEEKLVELHNILSNTGNLTNFLSEDRYFRSSVDNRYMAKYVFKEKRFKLLNEGGVESGVNFTYKIENGCMCNLPRCEVTNKGSIIKFVF